MIDTLKACLPQAAKRSTLREMGLEPREYGVVTIHRPSNVDFPTILEQLIGVLVELSAMMPVVFPVHPRTRARLQSAGLEERLQTSEGIINIPPLGYLDFLSITSQARLIVTDSGGLQEEATALSIPCLTMRANTERPITVEEGSSTLIGSDMDKLRKSISSVVEEKYDCGRCPEFWDGRAAERIVEILVKS